MLLKFLQEEQFSEKSNSGAALLSMMQNPEIHAYLLFLEYILDDFNKFNAYFQSQKTKIHLLQSAAENFLETILRNQSPQVIVGQACQDLLDQLNVEGQGEIVKLVYSNCLSFYNIAAKEICQKLFVKEEFLNKLKVFEPRFVLQQEDGDGENRSNEFVV